MTTINKTLEAIMQLDFNTREILLQILEKRQIEDRRKEIARNAKAALTSFKKGKHSPQTAADIIKKLDALD
ncbi:MAG TPA: hypothetical protein VI757_03350 [Bacteroidia bacterium]|nr:hypothetical protein [Bacteroidia bacterium]